MSGFLLTTWRNGGNILMRISLSSHARRRLRERNLGESDIEAVLRQPQKPGRDEEGNPIYRGMVSSIRVAVVVRKASTPPFVITVWYEQ
jgi:hypothetical protein